MSAVRTIYSFSECWSHDNGRKLTDHLEQVGAAIKEEIRSNSALSLPPYFCEVAILTGLFHDLGKATSFFQKKVRPPKDKSNDELSWHGSLSAVLTFHLIGQFLSKLKEGNFKDNTFLQIAATIAILRHHTNLQDWKRESTRLFGDSNKKVIRQQLKVLDVNGMNEWLGQLPDNGFKVSEEAVLSSFEDCTFSDMILDNLDERTWNISYALCFLYIYSLLISCDKLDAALGGERGSARVDIPGELVKKYKKREFGLAKTKMDRLRDRISSEVMKELSNHIEGPLYTITAPTGSGKTLTGLEVAIWLSEKLQKEGKPGRIIYCLPYTSIIDQNFEVYEKVLHSTGIEPTSDLLLKHHHLADMNFKARGEPESYDDDISSLLVESWSSEIVVTTFVQLFDTLFSGRNSSLKRFLRLAGSVVLLDEVQAIPRRYWEAVRETFLNIAKKFGTRIVLLTATRPLIFQDGDAVELLKEKKKYFSNLSRIRLHNHARTPTEFNDFCIEIARCSMENPLKDILVIVNTVKCSIDLYNYLNKNDKYHIGHKLYYLSTNITPRERRKRIKEIRDDRDKHPKLVISTQMVEAGVDISADIVHRDFAPLDCIIQSCGRCNRSGERGKGEVYLWRIVGPPPWSEKGFCKIYEKGSGSPVLLDVTENALGSKEKVEEKEFLELAEAYFQELRDCCASAKVLPHLSNMEFGSLGKEFRLIEDDSGQRQSYFVIDRKNDQKSDEIWEEYGRIKDISDSVEKHKQFLRLKNAFFDRVINVWRRWGEPVQEGILPIYSEQNTPGGYDPETGYIYGNGSGHLIC